MPVGDEDDALDALAQWVLRDIDPIPEEAPGTIIWDAPAPADPPAPPEAPLIDTYWHPQLVVSHISPGHTPPEAPTGAIQQGELAVLQGPTPNGNGDAFPQIHLNSLTGAGLPRDERNLYREAFDRLAQTRFPPRVQPPAFPIRRTLDYQATARRIFLVEELPDMVDIQHTPEGYAVHGLSHDETLEVPQPTTEPRTSIWDIIMEGGPCPL